MAIVKITGELLLISPQTLIEISKKFEIVNYIGRDIITPGMMLFQIEGHGIPDDSYETELTFQTGMDDRVELIDWRFNKKPE